MIWHGCIIPFLECLFRVLFLGLESFLASWFELMSFTKDIHKTPSTTLAQTCSWDWHTSTKNFINSWFRRCLVIQFHSASSSNRNPICSSNFPSKSSRQLPRNPTTNLSAPIALRLPKLQIPQVQPTVAFYRKTSSIPCLILSNHSKNGF